MTRLLTKIATWVAGISILRLSFRYLDPGSGSLLVQLLVALVVGLIATVGLWKDRLLTLLRLKKPAPVEDETEATPKQE